MRKSDLGSLFTSETSGKNTSKSLKMEIFTDFKESIFF